MIIFVAVLGHYPCPMPKWRAPATPVIVCPVGVKDEPTAFHLSVTKFGAAEARHLAWIKGQIHVLGRIAIEIVHVE